MDKLKFKMTYGLVGNDAIGSSDDRFYYLSEVNPNDGGRGQYFWNKLRQPNEWCIYFSLSQH